MGLADVIPGVSGGTMALILGIYDRLIAGFSILGPSLLRDLLRVELWRQLIQALKPTGEPSENRLGQTAQHLAFLLNVFVGIAVAILIGLKFLPQLLQSYPVQMRGFFFGLVLASVVVPYARIQRRSLVIFVVALVAFVGTWFLMGMHTQDRTGFAQTTVTLERADGQPFQKNAEIPGAWLQFHRNTGKKLRHNVAFSPNDTVSITVGQQKVEGIQVTALQAGEHANLTLSNKQHLDCVVSSVDPKALVVAKEWRVVQEVDATGGTDPALWYIFVCGAIAISAMLLPGVSGAFLLLSLGLYGYVIHQGHAFVYDGDTNALVPLSVFLAGIVLGLALFSRFLKWVLAHYEDVTMAVLIGLMFGSLRVLWPFQSQGGENFTPTMLDATTLGAIGAVIGGIVLVGVLTLVGRRAEQPDPT